MSNETLSLTDLINLYDDGEEVISVPPSGDDLNSPERIERQLQEGVKRGQLWYADDGRINDGGNALYVMIDTVNADDPRLATVIPLSNDQRAETDDSVVIEQGSPLDEPMVAWPELRAIIPVRLLHKPLKQFSDATVDAISGNDPTLADPNDVVRCGSDREENDDPNVENREDITVVLLKWHALCFDLPKLHSESQVPQHSKEDLEAYSNALKTILHLTPGQRIAVSRGKALTDEQQRKMAEAGFSNSPYSKPTVDDDYLIEVEQPLWRTAADAYAASGLPGDPRERLAYKAQFELAARVNGHGVTALRGALHKAANEVLAAADTINKQ